MYKNKDVNEHDHPSLDSTNINDCIKKPIQIIIDTPGDTSYFCSIINAKQSGSILPVHPGQTIKHIHTHVCKYM